MAAPSGTSWSSVFGSGNYQAKLGIYLTTANTDTQTTTTTQIWYWARYAVSDSSNTFYMDWDSYADTSIGSKSISTTNSEWATSNQILIGTYSKTFDKSTIVQTKYFSARFENIEYGGSSGSYYISFSVPALPTYTISYNANNGSGAPGSQTKTYGTNLMLSTIKPSRIGYSFVEWNTEQNGNGTPYSSGETYSVNKSVTLYAQWTPNRLTISYNVNSGSIGNEAFLSNSDGIITSSEEPHVIFQEFFYNDTLSEGLLTHDYFSLYKNGYKFIGWSLDKNDNLNLFDETRKDYIVSQFSKEIENGEVNVTLYAQWEIQNIAYLKINGKYSLCLTYLKINNIWTPCIAYIKTNGVYKQSIV